VVVRGAPGGLATVTCPTGGSITVAGSIGDSLRALLADAGADGVGLCGWGYRSPERQVLLRRQHCGTSSYAIYEMPSYQCSPPTARPGRSMHEQGLAVDFTCDGGSISSRGNSCFRWLDGHASRHGFYNLPSEPWHWSTNGR
jgi:LAS superfamily LD-carboxypeptidase LdcB